MLLGLSFFCLLLLLLFLFFLSFFYLVFLSVHTCCTRCLLMPQGTERFVTCVRQNISGSRPATRSEGSSNTMQPRNSMVHVNTEKKNNWVDEPIFFSLPFSTDLECVPDSSSPCALPRNTSTTHCQYIIYIFVHCFWEYFLTTDIFSFIFKIMHIFFILPIFIFQ